jgi:predicted RNase H-like nuclease (RuvC/YqgF family)
MDEGVKDLITEEPTVEVEAEDMEQEISLKDMITEIVKEVMATMKSQVSEEEMNGEEMKEEEKEVEMVESEMKDKEEKYSAYESEIASLKAQLQVYENKEKMALIEKFSMLDASFLEGLKSSLDSYSIDQLEAKLSIEAVRSGLVFNSTKQEVRTYSVDSIKNDSAPSWVKILEKL